MGHSHTHRGGNQPTPETAATRRRANLLLTAILGPLTVLTIIGMILLWPSGDRSNVQVVESYGGLSTQTGTVSDASIEPCQGFSGESEEATVECLVVELVPDAGGSAVSVEIPPEITSQASIADDSRIRYLDLGEQASADQQQYLFIDFVRTIPMALLAGVYALVVVLVARWRGFRALLGLAGAYAVMAYFILPGLVEGKPPLLLALVGSSVIMIGVLYFAHGFSARTSTALLGTIFGLVATSLIAAWASGASQLTGLNDDADFYLQTLSDNVSLSGVMLCGLIISGLGVLNDVTITQSSAVWEMHELAPESSARRLFAGAMRVGRDHIASTVYTIVFAYAGAALPLLILTSLQSLPFEETVTGGELAEEIVRTLVGSIGLVLAIPVTTAIAVVVVKAVGSKTVQTSAAIVASADEEAATAAAAQEPDYWEGSTPITIVESKSSE
ncbi:MAG: YibE/F family protein [Homoserinimonas sp.]